MSFSFPFEIAGTIAFALSGAMLGIDKKMDVFGVTILGLTTAVGGGILRDLILGLTPPGAFQKPVFALTAILVSLIAFLPSVRAVFAGGKKTYLNLILVMDSVGLGLFTVAGVQVAKGACAEPTLFLSTFVGVLTGVGGGVLRDLFAGCTPSIFVKHFYACAAILGALACALLWNLLGESGAMLAGAGITFALRILAARYHWSLPRAQ